MTNAQTKRVIEAYRLIEKLYDFEPRGDFRLIEQIKDKLSFAAYWDDPPKGQGYMGVDYPAGRAITLDDAYIDALPDGDQFKGRHRDDDFGVYDPDEALAKARWWLRVIVGECDRRLESDEPVSEKFRGKMRNLAANALKTPGIGKGEAMSIVEDAGQVLVESRNPEEVRHFFGVSEELADRARKLTGEDEFEEALRVLCEPNQGSNP